jgi:hypothetical protein
MMHGRGAPRLDPAVSIRRHRCFVALQLQRIVGREDDFDGYVRAGVLKLGTFAGFFSCAVSLSKNLMVCEPNK